MVDLIVQIVSVVACLAALCFPVATYAAALREGAGKAAERNRTR